MVFNRDESNNQMDPSDHHHPMMIVSGVHHSVTHSLTVVVLVCYNNDSSQVSCGYGDNHDIINMMHLILSVQCVARHTIVAWIVLTMGAPSSSILFSLFQ